MELTVLALVVAVVGLSLGLAGSRSAADARTARRLSVIERKLQVVMDHLGAVEPVPQLPEVVAHLEHGNKILAIKAYRTATGADLKQAKTEVEAIARQRGL